MPLTNAWDICIHLFQESEMAYIFQCEFRKSLRLKLSPEMNIISKMNIPFPQNEEK